MGHNNRMNEIPNQYGIPTLEFEKRRNVFEMCEWINAKFKEMEQQENFDTIYFERKGQNVKKLIEEAIPTAYLGLQLFRMADDLFIECKTGNQPFDALLEVVGFRNFKIKIEVTTTEDDATTMRRQSLSRTGFTFFSGPVRREGREIICEPEMVDMDIEEQAWVDLAFDRFLQKARSDRYDSNTAILVCINTHRTWRFDSRHELVTKTYKYLLKYNPEIYGVYYCYVRDAVVDEVKESSYWLRR